MKKKIKEWLKRYLFAEILSTILSLGTAWSIKVYFNEDVMAAFAGSAMASISFYGLVAFSDVRKNLKYHKKHKLKYGFNSYIKDFRNLLVEFGPSEILDVIAVRPFFMYLIPKLTGEFLLGTFIGKMIADVIFFIPAVVMYEIRKKHLS